MFHNIIATSVEAFILTKYYSLYTYMKERCRLWWYSNENRMSESILNLKSLVITKSSRAHKRPMMISDFDYIKVKTDVWKNRQSEISDHQKKLSGSQMMISDWYAFWWYPILMIFNQKHTVSKYHQPEISDHKIKLSETQTVFFDYFRLWWYPRGSRLSQSIVNLKSRPIRKVLRW